MNTLALVYEDGDSGFKFFSQNQHQCCPFKSKEDRNLWFKNNLIGTQSSFGGMSFYKTVVINTPDIKYSLGKHNNINFYCELIGFNECLNRHGKIYDKIEILPLAF